MGVIKLHIKLLSQPQLSLNNMINMMNQTYSSAGININILSNGSLPTNNELNLLNNINVGECNQSPSTDLSNLSSYRGNVGNKEIVAFFVKSVYRTGTNRGVLNGCATHPINKPMIVISQIATIYTLAHELGHVLGLRHERLNRNSLMYYSTNQISNPPPDISNSEINIINSSNYIFQTS